MMSPYKPLSSWLMSCHTYVVETIVDIVCNHDLIAIQEVSDKSEKSIQELHKRINEKCSDEDNTNVTKVNPSEATYGLVLSPRTGRSSASAEQYAVFYKEDSFTV